MTTSDYVDYARQPDTAFLFESAARELAQRVNEEPAAAVFVQRRFWEGWPSVRFLLTNGNVNWFAAGDDAALPDALTAPAALYLWPYDELAFIARTLQPPLLISIEEGGAARGDLEAEPYALYVRYAAQRYDAPPPQVLFDQNVALHAAALSAADPRRLQVAVDWAVRTPPAAPLTAFVHVLARDAAGGPPLAQADEPLATGYWPVQAWQPGQVVRQQFVIHLNEPFDNSRYQVVVGLYDAVTNVRLLAFTPQGAALGDSWPFAQESHAHEEN